MADDEIKGLVRTLIDHVQEANDGIEEIKGKTSQVGKLAEKIDDIGEQAVVHKYAIEGLVKDIAQIKEDRKNGCQTCKLFSDFTQYKLDLSKKLTLYDAYVSGANWFVGGVILTAIGLIAKYLFKIG